MEGRPQKDLVLILARELSANVATPLMVVDPWGTMVFYNDSAERILGQSFKQTGELKADEYRGIISPEDDDGNPIPYEKLPVTIALTDRRPCHQELVITGFDGVKRKLAVTCFPLMANNERLVGGVLIFWDRAAD